MRTVVGKKDQNKANRPVVQTKPVIGQPNDKYEQEADQVAEKVVQMPEPPPPMSFRRKERDEDEDDYVQMKPLAGKVKPLEQKKIQGKPIQKVMKLSTVNQPTNLLQRQVEEADGFKSNEKLNKVFSKVKTTSTYHNLTKGYQGEDSRLDLEFDVVDQIKNVSGRTRKRNGKILIEISEAYIKKASDISIARTIYHELIHARHRFQIKNADNKLSPDNYPGLFDYYRRFHTEQDRDWKHNLMAAHARLEIIQGLKEYDSEEWGNNINRQGNIYVDKLGKSVAYSEEDFYEAMSWKGLTIEKKQHKDDPNVKTEAWKIFESQNPEKAILYQAIFQQEANLYKYPVGPEIEIRPKRQGTHTSEQAPESFEKQLNTGAGQMLPPRTLNMMNRSFGADFSPVKIHHGARAAQLNQDIGAKAFTYGQDIYFNKGQFRPENKTGRKLLAHELTHTLQQNNQAPKIQKFNRNGDEEEEMDPAEIKANVDELAKEINKNYGWKNFKPEEAIGAYRMIQQRSPKEIEAFYDEYPELASEIDWYLPGKFRSSKAFGFFRGVSDEEAEKLIALLDDPEIWEKENIERFTLVMEMIMDAFIQTEESSGKIILPKKIEDVIQKNNPAGDHAKELKKMGFVGHKFVSQKYVPKDTGKEVKSMLGIGLKYLFGTEKDKSRNVAASLGMWYLEPLGRKNYPKLKGFSLAQLEDAMGGTSMGIDFTYETNKAKGSAQGKLDFEADYKEGTAEVLAQELPFAGINYQGDTYTFRSGKGSFDGLVLNLKWNTKEKTKETEKTEETGKICLYMAELEINNLRMIMDEETYGIGQLKISGLELELSQNLGPAKELENTLNLLGRITTVLTDISSLLTFGLVQSMYRFSGPDNKEGLKERDDDRKEFGELLVGQFFEDLDLKISFNNLTLQNFIYLDKDLTKDDEDELTNKEKPEVEVMESITTGRTEIDLRSINGPENPEKKQELYQLKKELLEAKNKKETYQEKYEKHFFKGNDKKAEKYRKKLEGSNDEDYQKKRTKYKRKLRRHLRKGHHKRALKLEEKIKALRGVENIITEQENKIRERHPDPTFELVADVNDFSTSKGDMLNKIGGSLLDDYTGSTSGLGDAQASSFTYRTEFHQQGISNTSVALKDLVIPELSLNCLYYEDKNGDLVLSADKTVLKNTKASLDVFFKDQKPEPFLAQLEPLESELKDAHQQLDDLKAANAEREEKMETGTVKKKIKRISLQIAALIETYTPGETESYEIEKEIKQLKRIYDQLKKQDPGSEEFEAILVAARPTHEEIGLQIERNEKLLNPVKQVYIRSLDIDSAEVHQLFLSKNQLQLTALFNQEKPITLEGISVKNMLVRNTMSGYNVEPGEEGEKAEIDLTRLTIPENLLLEKGKIDDDKALKQFLDLKLSEVTAEGIDIDILKSGGIDYTLQDLSALSGDITSYEYDKNGQAIPKQSQVNLPGRGPEADTENKEVPFISGHYEDGLHTISLNIPEINIPNLNFGDDQLQIKLKEGSQPSKLTDLQVEIEYDATPQKRTQTETKSDVDIPAFTIKRLFIGDASVWGLFLRMMRPADLEALEEKQDLEIDFPINKEVSIKGIELLNYRIENSANPKNQNKVEWHYTPDAEKASLSTGTSRLPQGIMVTDLVNHAALALQKNAHWDTSLFTLLEHGGLAYDFANLEAAIHFWKKDSEGEIEKEAEGAIDSKTIAGAYKKEKIGDGKNAKTKTTIKTQANIPVIKTSFLNLISDQLKITISETSQGAEVSEVNADVQLTILTPSISEREKASEKGTKLKDDIKVRIKRLDIKEIKATGLTIWQKSEKREKESGELTEDKIINISIPDTIPASIRSLSMQNMFIHRPMIGKATAVGKGSIGKAEGVDKEAEKGLDIDAVNFKKTDNIKETIIDAFGIPLEADKIIFEADPDGSIKLAIEKPDIHKDAYTNVRYDFKDENGRAGFFNIFKKDDGEEVFAADQIVVNIDSEGAKTFVLEHPSLNNLQLYHDNSTYEVDGKIEGQLKITEGVGDFGGGEEAAWVISSDEDVILSNLNVNLKKSSTPPKTTSIFRLEWGETPRFVEYEVEAGGNTQLDFLDTSNGDLTISIHGISSEAIPVTAGKVSADDLGVILGNLFQRLINNFLNWGDNAMDFFNWVDTYAYWDESDWLNPLMEELNINDRVASREFFAEWVNDQLNQTTLFTEETAFIEGVLIRNGIYIQVGDIVEQIQIAEGEGSRSDVRRQQIPISLLLEYPINKPGSPPPLPNLNLPEDWDIEAFPTLEDLFGEFLTNPFYWDPDATYGWTDPPNGARINAAMEAWITKKLISWIVSDLAFDVNLKDLDLAAISGLEFKDPGADKDLKINMHGNTDGSSLNTAIKISSIPGFTYLNEKNNTIVSAGGVSLSESIFQIPDIDEVANSNISNEKITISGLTIKRKK